MRSVTVRTELNSGRGRNLLFTRIWRLVARAALSRRDSLTIVQRFNVGFQRQLDSCLSPEGTAEYPHVLR